MMKTAKTTTDHETIRRWVEEHGGRPAAVKNTLAGDDAGVLYLDFPGYGDKDVDELAWETFFRKFDDERLAFVYQDEAPDGNPRRACALVARQTGEAVGA